jgi:hypothetical protein
MQQGHEADHSPPSSAEVKNGGATPPLPICHHGMVLNELIPGMTLLFYRMEKIKTEHKSDHYDDAKNKTR